MSKTVYKTGSVPTVRYRILAIVFFLLAVAGLFLGYFGKYFSLLSHSNVVLLPYTGLQLNGGTLVEGSLFGYLYETLKHFFTSGVLLDFGLNGRYIRTLLGFVQIMTLCVAIVMSLVFGIAACITRGKATRNCAMASGYLVAGGYLWIACSVLFYGNGAATPSITLFGKVTLCFDLPIFLIGGLALAILVITTLCRRRLVGLFNCLTLALMGGLVIAICIPGTLFNTFAHECIDGWTLGVGLYRTNKTLAILMYALIFFSTINIVLTVFRLNAKRFYPFDAVRYGLLLVTAIVFNVLIICNPAWVDGNRWAMFQYSRATLVVNIYILATGLFGMLFGIFNSLLIANRRRNRNARSIAAEFDKDRIDREDDAEMAAYEMKAPLERQDPYTAPASQPYPNPYGQPYPPVQQPAPQPAQPQYMPYAQQPAPQAAPQPAQPQTIVQPIVQPMPFPQPAPMPYPMSMPMMMGMGMPSNVMPPYNQQGPSLQQQPQQGPIVFQQAPATPPVVIVQVPPMQPASAPEAKPAPAAEPDAKSEPAPSPEERSEAAPALDTKPESSPNPAAEPAPEPLDEDTLNDFERLMLAAARGEEPEETTESAPAPAVTAPAEPAKVYGGAYDAFFDSLSDAEKEEFHTLFINRVKGDFGLPAYKIGDDNSEFFKRIFSSLGKFRKYISSGLLSKIYNYANK